MGWRIFSRILSNISRIFKKKIWTHWRERERERERERPRARTPSCEATEPLHPQVQVRQLVTQNATAAAAGLPSIDDGEEEEEYEDEEYKVEDEDEEYKVEDEDEDEEYKVEDEEYEVEDEDEDEAASYFEQRR